LPSAVNSNEDDALRGVSTALAVMSSMADLRDRYNFRILVLASLICPHRLRHLCVPRLRSRKFYAGRRLSWLPIENGAILSEELAKFEESDLKKYPGGTFKVAEKAVGMLGANFQDYSLLIDDKTSTTLEDAHAKLVTSRYNFLWAIFRDQSVQLDERKKMLAVAERVASSGCSVQENRIAAEPAAYVEMTRWI